ncbi:hypothetical protein KW787_01715 [Candidatus Pacearchaeota archaeon]|nr:hypothetical protein [Candidatus Pacearchaeota archaeon]
MEKNRARRTAIGLFIMGEYKGLDHMIVGWHRDLNQVTPVLEHSWKGENKLKTVARALKEETSGTNYYLVNSGSFDPRDPAGEIYTPFVVKGIGTKEGYHGLHSFFIEAENIDKVRLKRKEFKAYTLINMVDLDKSEVDMEGKTYPLNYTSTRGLRRAFLEYEYWRKLVSLYGGIPHDLIRIKSERIGELSRDKRDFLNSLIHPRSFRRSA